MSQRCNTRAAALHRIAASPCTRPLCTSIMKQTLWQPLPITYRGFVYPSQLNPHGRLRERVQVGCFDQASWHLLALLGVGPRRLHETGRGFITLEHRVASMQPAGTA